jgi:ankyrin repeat protein
MRLLLRSNNSEFSFTKDLVGDDAIPPYAILSHTWKDGQEVTFQDLVDGTGESKTGHNKIRFCAQQAERDGLQYFWVDTCCIDKSNHTELQEAINSMFRWYQNAAKCYVYLLDVSIAKRKANTELSEYTWEQAFRESRWFTRGWTLQELLAPCSVEFFSREGKQLGDKRTLEQQVSEITGIATLALQGNPLHEFGIEERLSWAKGRQTTRKEDKAYSLLGVFGVYMPLIYGEGDESAFRRLRKEIEPVLTNESPALLSALSTNQPKQNREPVSTAPLNEEQKRMLLDSLKFDQIDARQLTIKTAHVKTCKWLLKKCEYIDWLDATKLDKHHGFLWIKGNPGTGKSTLMKYAVTNARKLMKNKIVISFFFNARGEDMEKTTIGTYRSLLLQLLERLPALQDVFNSLSLSTSNINAYHQWSIESLETLLGQAIQGLGEIPVMCFIDALDECKEDQIRDMISFFERIGKLAVLSRIRFQVCFSSRHYPHITIQKGLDLVLEGQEGHSQDIVNYISSELKIGHSKIAEQIRTELQEKASGIFMWAVLVGKILNKEYDSGRMHALRRRLQEIPSDLHDLFRDILTRDSQNRDELVLCIQWVLFSRQPLSPAQLYFAILSGIEPEALSTLDSDKDVIKRFILNSSKGLVEITTSKIQKVQFIHESVKDFLVKENGLKDILPDLGGNFQGQSHERLKLCCLNYMNMDVFTPLAIPESLPKASSQNAESLRQSATGTFPFLDYAVRNVLYHADVAAGCGIAQENLIQSFPLDRWIKLDNLFEKHNIRRHTEDVSLLYVLAEGNMPNLIRIHPSILSWLDVGKERYGPPLFAALATKSKEAVQTFLEAQAANLPLGNRLHELCSQYQQDEGKQSNIGRDFKFSNRMPVISYLAELGDSVVFAVLLETGQVDFDLKDKSGRTPILWAASKGHEAVVKLLLETGQVEVNSKDQKGQTPLSWAAANGHVAVVKLLIETGQIEVESKDKYGWTPLYWAARNGHEAVVKLLIETGQVEVDLKDQHGRTPLSWAAESGYETMVKLLLETGQVEVDLKDQNGQTPLWQAAMNGHEAVVKLLLETGQVEVDLKDQDGQTPLWWAAMNGCEAVVKLLLETGQAKVDLKDQDGQTPLWWAAMNGCEAVVKLLLETGQVEVDSKDQNGRTPLSWATANGRKAVVKLLLETGQVEVNSKDQSGQTPLLRAASDGFEAVVKLLLEVGQAKVNLKDQSGQTPLSRAASNGCEAVVKLLLKTGQANVDSKDQDGRTPLSFAASNWRSNEAVVKLLLETGQVEVDLKDKSGRTPLSWAAKSGHKAIFELLQSYV